MSLALTYNGNAYQSNNLDGTTGAIRPYRRRAAAQPAKYLRLEDMALTKVQKQQASRYLSNKTTTVHEDKYVGTQVVGGTAVTTGATTDMTSFIAQGNDDSSRVGDNIMLRDVEIRYTVKLNPSFTYNNGGVNVRTLVVQWFEDTTISPLTMDLVLFTAFGAPLYLAPYLHDRDKSFKVLYDEVVTLSTQSPYNASRVVQVFPTRKHCDYVSNGTTGRNHIYVMQCSDVTSTSYPPIVSVLTRINYVDS